MLQESKKEIASLQSEEKKLSRLKETAKTRNEGAIGRQLIRLRSRQLTYKVAELKCEAWLLIDRLKHAHASVGTEIQGATKAMAAMSKLNRLRL
ncbi:vacuolar protein sorting-associated protein 2 homolog 3-like isoform X2 [Brassica rapa]|uniref:vacuolar protein sorting-associated protein 2 homolog 3-like isoform X2 n=1 Tax=Brassica campestris TaxID=3711 RepID=UPI0004F1CD6C|nr:vacuolar protein sorting-associated protein 2 homolog 3-like isoform X2 [Brassica rapa]